ncbi:unnamed protein product (macronuclear) [Paramecium tetraurelia]|uniref:Major facilitator superfamily (MFS) profile domain-containing protein n=1 Tax=Paramecium tetraurelia TaxID=5888 RepID=A0DYP9_PARTE|nr:uncharacterized protein GSPATT00003134001 [Paramecium tetraurelia]CAK88166.1 unnamed protein product [Paramecium tetraurelia]|eukprot:XP_001455563.1 hypothetical protein (macronuclear) [Paramecium tetraurelia strain d4-2]
MDKRLFSKRTFHFLTIIFINFDHGIIPACTQRIESDFGINEFELGLLSSSVFAGIIIGTMIGAGIYDKFKTKSILITCSLLYILSISVFLITKNIVLLHFSRFFTGLFQVCFINLIGIFSYLFSCLD